MLLSGFLIPFRSNPDPSAEITGMQTGKYRDPEAGVGLQCLRSVQLEQNCEDLDILSTQEATGESEQSRNTI